MDLSIFRAKLEEIKNRLVNHKNIYMSNESAVRSQIVEPLLKVLGWDLENPNEVIPEPGTEEGRPDYELKCQNGSSLLIEVKNLSKEPVDALRQLGKYCYSTGVKFGVATNGAVWLLFRSFEEGRSVQERIVWKLELCDDSSDQAYGKLWTIAKENISKIDDLIKKEQILEESWSKLADNPSPEFINAVRSVISDSTLEFDEEEIKSFIMRKIKEIDHPQQQSPGTEPPMYQSRQDKGIEIGGQFIRTNKAYEILTQTAEWLIRKGKLTDRDVPIEAGHKRHLVNRKPKHKDEEEFSQRQQLSNGLYIETKFSTQTPIKHARTLLKRFGYAENHLVVTGF